ncbi:MAG TPA: MFS transporter [Anaerolineae bacterium]|nr:MFS transporter [Anaerolineae bacterium]
MITNQFKNGVRRLVKADVPAPDTTDTEFNAEVERNYRWNFTFNLLDVASFWIGMSFLSSATIVPLYVSKLTGSALAIGLVAVIANSGWFLPQIFTANGVQGLARKKPVVVNLGFFTERLPLWLLPISALLAVHSPTLALILFFIGYAGHGLGAGIIATAWQDMIARCFPVDRRGRFFGISSFVGSSVGIAAATFSAWLLAMLVFPTNFAVSFALAAMFVTISWAFLSFTREPVQPGAQQKQSNRQFWSSLPDILRSDRNFRNFLIGRLLIMAGGIGTGFVTVAAVQTWGIGDGIVGLYTTSMLIGQTIGTLGFGFLADRRGHKISVELGALASLLAFLIAWLAVSPVWYYVVFLLLGIVSGAMLVSGLMIVMEFSTPGLRPTYAGLTNTSLGVLGIITPLIGAWLASQNYDWLFAVGAACSLAGWVVIRWFVREPRYAQPVVIVPEAAATM